MRILAPIYKFYEWLLWRQIKKGEKPRHIGVILDGNRRYAKQLGLETWNGHKIGAEKVKDFLEWCWEAGIKVVTLYVFSTENFKRNRREVEEIMRLAKKKFEEVLTDSRIHKHQVRIKAIGRLHLLPKDVRDVIKKAEEETKLYNKYFLNVAIGYGGRAEIVDALRKIAKMVAEGKLNPESIDENLVEKYLYTAGLPDPDLIIRTSGEERLSGFLLWQSAYSEFYFLDVYWPAVRKIDLWRAIRTYQQRQRRFGR